ncbi:MAG: class I SAM-dependent methyltransferase [Gaiellales bacterium]
MTYPREIALAGSEHLDPAYVAGYDRKAGFDPAGDLDALRAHGLDQHSVLIELGAGTGTFALAAAMICRRVVAVDVSPAMTDAIRRNAAVRGVANVECVQAGFLSYEHEGDPPNVIYTRNALHHLPDFWKGVALSRMAALLSPGGILQLRDLAFSFDPPEAQARIAGWLDAMSTERPEDGWTRQELEAHLRDEYSTFTWLLEPMITRSGLEILSADYADTGAYAGYICVKRGTPRSEREPGYSSGK